MFIGGTNFGFMNGSNYYDVLTPDVTSYDYDALLTEDGQITPKYEAFREVIAKYAPVPEVAFSTEIKRKDDGRLIPVRRTGLFENLGNLTTAVESVCPQSMEKLDQGYGYILYETALEQEPIEKIRLYGANDRANIFVDQKPVLTLYDRELLTEHELEQKPAGDTLSILVENMGRVNFGPTLERQRKGIDHCVTVNSHQLYHWKQFTLPMEDLSRLDYSLPHQEGTPGFYQFTFQADELGDTFLDFAGWGKGCVWVNGFNIGRFWEIGPQKRLYVPAPLLKQGENEIVIFETEGKAGGEIWLAGCPDLG